VNLKKLFAGLEFAPRTDSCDRAFLYLLTLSFILRIAWLDRPPGSLIFDEKYYVNVARIILGRPHDLDVYPDAVLGVDPNHEHPPLAKLIIALSMLILGDNAYGFRLPSVIAGTVSIFIFYLLMKKVSRSQTLALVSSFLFSFDNLIFVHSRIATLDIFMLAFMLIGFYFYFAKRTFLSAAALSLSTLSKIGGAYGFATILVYHLLKKTGESEVIREGSQWRVKLEWLEKFGIAYVACFMALLMILDRIWGGYENPLEHLSFIYSYTLALSRPVLIEIESYPWQWLINEVKIPYLTVAESVYADHTLVSTYVSVAFVGAMNPFILFFTIPSIAYMAYLYGWKKDNSSLFILAWFSCTYLPFYPMSIIGHRISYIFYFLNTIPSVCAAVTSLILDQRPPKILIGVYLIAVIVGFILLFPFKTIP